MINLRNWAITPTFGYLISMEGLGWLGWGGGGVSHKLQIHWNGLVNNFTS